MAEQNYANHARYHAPFHFVLSPLLLVNLIWSIYRLVRNPDADGLQQLLVAVALFLTAFVARVSALKAQDRVIRLEERLRYERDR